MSLSKLHKSVGLKNKLTVGQNVFNCRLPAINVVQKKMLSLGRDTPVNLNILEKSVRILAQLISKDLESFTTKNVNPKINVKSQQKQDHHHHLRCARNALVYNDPSTSGIQANPDAATGRISSSTNFLGTRDSMNVLFSGNQRFCDRSNHEIWQKLNLRFGHSLPKNFHTSAHRSQGDRQQKNDDKYPKKDDEQKMLSLMVKVFIWMTMGYIFVATIALMFPSSDTPDIMRWVSWNEFMFHMLAKGEVEEIIVRPENEIVSIILHEGAVIKGKRTEHRTFHMNIGDIVKFESKLRQAEDRLGIRSENRVPVIYSRNVDSASKIITSLIIALVVFSFLTKTKAFKMDVSMNSFLNIGKAKFTLVDAKPPGKGVRFDDVAGLKEPKQEVKEFVDYLKRPDIYKKLGAKVPKGALL